ncbi:hypothetical protein BKA70DRAFT_1445621 [Coprinopsis sp. MPI-PUGE-AT-0042]|nr:hypothetical protein BKA70DRAFT_1445621 [Coprinopsis sp. MPI-PUGE-AT-0042]
MPKDSSHSTTTPLSRRRSQQAPGLEYRESATLVISSASQRSPARGKRRSMRVTAPEQSQTSDILKTSRMKELEKQVSTLKSAVGRLKNKLEEKSEMIRDLKTDIQQLKGEIETMEEEADEKDELLDAKGRDVEQYRNWWLNEVQFMKLLLNKIPEPNRDVDLVRASQAHYLGHY